MSRNIRNCNVCVVGGAGFLGSHLVNHLIEDRGCKVTVLDNLVSGRKSFVHDGAKFIWCDITGSETRLRNIFKEGQIQYVFNYAAMPYIPVSFARPLHVCDVNFMGALKVINAAQDAGVEAILQVSSAEIYGNGVADKSIFRVARKMDEETEICPHSSYGAAKAAIDALIQVRWKEANTPCIALRQFNCVGEYETHPYVIPEIINQLYANIAADQPETLVGLDTKVYLGNNSERDFQYAGDAVNMATELLEKGEFGQCYNMGSESTIHIYDLAKLIGEEIMGFESVEVIEDPTRVRPWEIWHLQSDNSKLYSVIDSRPTVSLEDALQRTLTYFEEQNFQWGF